MPPRTTSKLTRNLGRRKHEHALLPVEYGHPVTVTNADVPAGVTTENIAVLELGGSSFSSLSGNDFPMNNWTSAFQMLRDRQGDRFDFVIFFSDPRLPRIPYSGYHRGVYNEVTGINRTAVNSRNTWGSERLQSQIWMGRFSLGTLLQEIGHRWGSFARYRTTQTGTRQNDLTLSDGAHWARQFDDGNSPMDYDEVRHIRQTSTTWLREPIGGLEFRFNNLDLYLMGIIPKAEVGTFTLIRNYAETGSALPGGRQMISGNARNLTARNVVWSEGDREPAYPASQTHFRAAFAVITRDADGLDQTFVQKVEVLRQQLATYFSIASQNRACMNTELCSGNTLSRSGQVRMRLQPNNITRSGQIYHGLGPIPSKVELGFESTVGGRKIDVWSREETPDITAGVQELSAQVNRDPYDGKFEIVGQAKGSADLTLNINWWASAIS